MCWTGYVTVLNRLKETWHLTLAVGKVNERRICGSLGKVTSGLGGQTYGNLGCETADKWQGTIYDMNSVSRTLHWHKGGTNESKDSYEKSVAICRGD